MVREDARPNLPPERGLVNRNRQNPAGPCYRRDTPSDSFLPEQAGTSGWTNATQGCYNDASSVTFTDEWGGGTSAGCPSARLVRIGAALTRAEQAEGSDRTQSLSQLATQLDREGGRSSDRARVRALAAVVRGLASGSDVRHSR